MEITEEQINKIFELASIEKKKPKEEITSSDITEALIEIERKIYSFATGVKIDSLENKKILIADDLELSIYQLSTVLKRIGVTPSVARHKEEALSELNKVQFDCVIIDLFIPDSSDGIDLIKAAVKKRNDTGFYSKIVVISGTDDTSLIEVADSSEVKIGPAVIYTVLEDEKVEKFEIEITKINENSEIKNISFEITDQELLDKTGGVVQGMSGSPIVQNDKLIGAVTHVVTDNVTTGYGLFITTMLEESEK